MIDHPQAQSSHPIGVTKSPFLMVSVQKEQAIPPILIWSFSSVIRRLQFIQRAKLIGLPLAKIKELVVHLGEQECACATLRPHLEQMIRGQLKEVRGRLDQLALLKEELEGLLGKMGRGKRPLPEEFCACAGEGRTAPARLLQIRPKGGSR